MINILNINDTWDIQKEGNANYKYGLIKYPTDNNINFAFTTSYTITTYYAKKIEIDNFNNVTIIESTDLTSFLNVQQSGNNYYRNINIEISELDRGIYYLDIQDAGGSVLKSDIFCIEGTNPPESPCNYGSTWDDSDIWNDDCIWND